MWIATVTLQTPNDKYPDNNSRKNSAQNKDRMAALLRIISSLSTQVSGDGIILFPGGWFHNGKKPAKSLLPFIETSITPELQKISAHIIVSFGVDGSLDDGGYDGDQVAVVIDKNGIIAAGRKFQAVTQNESQRIFLAPDYLSGEFGKPRIFSLNGVRFYPAICYDTYGPQQKKFPNPGADVILSHVHYFVPINEHGPKGVVDFVRKGFAGSSAQWHCPVFGAAIFIRRQIPKSWHTCMNYRTFTKSYSDCKIDENSVIPIQSFEDDNLKEGSVIVQIYDLNLILKDKENVAFPPPFSKT